MHSRLPIVSDMVAVQVLRRCGERTEVLLLRRAPDDSLGGMWCQVAGKMEHGEAAWQTGLRELFEETGLVPEQFYSADVCEQFYERSRERIVLAPVFVAFVSANAPVKLDHEHTDYCWLNLEQALALLPFLGQRRVLREVWEAFVEQPPLALLRIDTKP